MRSQSNKKNISEDLHALFTLFRHGLCMSLDFTYIQNQHSYILAYIYHSRYYGYYEFIHKIYHEYHPIRKIYF